MGLFSRSSSDPSPAGATPAGTRRLFLDDDPGRAEIFLRENPGAVWVETAADCIARLAEPWDEVHLDHDLGGETFVDHAREDCGMEVVRWLCQMRRAHLRYTAFYVHSHNAGAATTMGLQLMNAGYTVELRPFGAPPLPPLPEEGPPPGTGPLGRLLFRVREWLFGPREHAADYGYDAFDRTAPAAPGEPPPPVEKLDLSWTRPGANLPRGVPKAVDLPGPVEKLDLSWGKPQVPPTAPRNPDAPPRPPSSSTPPPASPPPPPPPRPRADAGPAPADDVAFDPY